MWTATYWIHFLWQICSEINFFLFFNFILLSFLKRLSTFSTNLIFIFDTWTSLLVNYSPMVLYSPYSSPSQTASRVTWEVYSGLMTTDLSRWQFLLRSSSNFYPQVLLMRWNPALRSVVSKCLYACAFNIVAWQIIH